jgi:hypothetical protein
VEQLSGMKTNLKPIEYLPKEVRILHSTFKVRTDNQEYLDGMERYGEMNHSKKQISIADQAASDVVDTFVHEVFHGISCLMDIFEDKSIEEHVVTTLATGLTTFMMDNPEVLPMLQEIINMSKKDVDKVN